MHRLAVIAIALCGCRDHQAQQVKAIRDEVCACKTVECGEAAMKRLPAQSGTPGHRLQVLANEMMTCMAKLYLKDRPSEDPDAPDAAAPEAPASETGSGSQARPTGPGSSDPASARRP